jgi:hypothetical protein
MAMVCPRCNVSYEQRLQCEACGTRLLYSDRARRPSRPAGNPAPRTAWQQTPWGRILIGLLLAQGLFFGLRHLLTGVMLAVSGAGGRQTVQGVVLLQVLQVLTLMAGCVLAGSGQRRGLLLGAVVGVWNGALSALLHSGPAQPLTPVSLAGQLLLQTTFGSLAGWFGCLIWKPLPAPGAAVPGAPARKPEAVGRLGRPRAPLFQGRVAWVRVAAGAALAVAGTLSATLIFDKMIDASGGLLATTHEVQDRIITWEIKALAVLLGGVLAGAGTRNGLKQGLCVGVLTSAILMGIQARYANRWPAIVALTALGSFSLSLVGGWFGSHLFPPVVKARRRRGPGPASFQ